MTYLKKGNSQSATNKPHRPDPLDSFRSKFRAVRSEAYRLIAEGHVSKLDMIEELEGQSSAILQGISLGVINGH